MAQTTRRSSPAEPTRWHRATGVFLAGLAIASAGFFHIAVVQTPGLDPPPETAAIFLVQTTAAAVSYLFLREGLPAVGYVAAVLTGAFGFLAAVVIVTGRYGAAGPETNPLGPIAWLLLAALVIVSAVLAWRG